MHYVGLHCVEVVKIVECSRAPTCLETKMEPTMRGSVQLPNAQVEKAANGFRVSGFGFRA